MSWNAHTKNDLIIEVWEKLDCEDIGAGEIKAIETAVAARFGDAAVDSPMAIARQLADEGAHLRHSEIMNLYVERSSERPYDAAFRNLINIESLASTEASIGRLENLRRKYVAEDDKTGLRLVRDAVIAAKRSTKQAATGGPGGLNIEIAEWLTIWLQTPEIFADWLALRKKSPAFIANFGDNEN